LDISERSPGNQFTRQSTETVTAGFFGEPPTSQYGALPKFTFVMLWALDPTWRLHTNKWPVSGVQRRTAGVQFTPAMGRSARPLLPTPLRLRRGGVVEGSLGHDSSRRWKALADGPEHLRDTGCKNGIFSVFKTSTYKGGFSAIPGELFNLLITLSSPIVRLSEWLGRRQ